MAPPPLSATPPHSSSQKIPLPPPSQEKVDGVWGSEGWRLKRTSCGLGRLFDYKEETSSLYMDCYETFVMVMDLLGICFIYNALLL